MRLSPTLFAVIAISGIVGLPSKASGQSAPATAGQLPVRPSSTLVAALEDEALAPAEGVGPFTASSDIPGDIRVEDLETIGTGSSQPVSAPLPTAVVSLELAGDGEFSPVPTDTSPAVNSPQPSSPNPSVSALQHLLFVEQSSVHQHSAADLAQLPENPNPNSTVSEPPGNVPAPATEAPASEGAEATEASPEDATPAEASPASAPEGQESEDSQATPEEPRVLVAEVAVTSPNDDLSEELKDQVYRAIETRPGRTTTRTQLQQDINNIFATGFFSNVRALPEDTPLGVRVTFLVQPNPVLQSVRVVGNDVLPQERVDEIFSPQYGKIINLIDFQDGILELNEWYQENGYVLAQVVAAPEVSEDGVVTLEVAEGVVETIRVRFLTAEGEAEDEEGNPIDGKTHDYIITREFETQPGDVFNQQQIETDLQRVFGLGIFDDVRLSLEPGKDDPRKVDVVVNVTERNTGSVAAGLGFNFTGDLFGTVSYRQDNFGGNNQKFGAEAQVSGRDLLFDISFTDPWIAGDPFRTSYSVDAFARRSINLNFDGGPEPIDLPNGDRVRVRRLGTGVSFSRPLSGGWTASLGTRVENVSTRDANGRLAAFDAAGNPLTWSATENGGAVDDLWTINFTASQDRRNDPFNPTSGSLLRLSTEQSIPLGSGSIFMNRIRAGYSYYIPVSFLNFTDGPQAIAFNVQAGTILGEVPPYEAFALGGTNSIRGYDEGAVGSGRSYAQATIEYRFPLFSFLGGALFIDAGTDLGSGFAVPGAPGPSRGKPGSGLGYGLGIRVQTPLGPLRIDYGLSIDGGGRLSFGIGERF